MTDLLALDEADDDVLWLVEESSVQMRGTQPCPPKMNIARDER